MGAGRGDIWCVAEIAGRELADGCASISTVLERMLRCGGQAGVHEYLRRLKVAVIHVCVLLPRVRVHWLSRLSTQQLC